MRRPDDLAATSQLELGARGMFEGAPFTLIGRRCVQGSRGQIWNDWTLAFDHDGPSVSLAESCGTFTLFREGSLLQPPEALVVGMAVAPPWLVVERGRATRLAKWGDLDEAAPAYDYVDLSYRGAPEQRATLAEDGTFLGEPTDAASLGLTLRAAAPALIPAPDVSMPAGIELWLDLGDVGTLEGVEYRVLGIAARRADAAPPSRWQDYLLYNARIGLRWLSVTDGHWTYATPVEVGPTGFDLEHVSESTVGVLEWAAGELPWSAELGEQAAFSEREDLVFEHTFLDVSAARIQELTPDAVAKAFGKRSLPRPR